MFARSCAVLLLRSTKGSVPSNPGKGGRAIKAERVCHLVLPGEHTCVPGGNPPLVDRWVGCLPVGTWGPHKLPGNPDKNKIRDLATGVCALDADLTGCGRVIA